MRFRPEQHLRRQSDFRAVREQGRRMQCGAFTLSWRFRTPPLAETAESPDAVETKIPVARVGVVASAAAVGGAVERNRAKRRLRAVFREHQSLVPAGCDLVLSARSSLNQLGYAELVRKFVEACRQITPQKNG
jgi:ribonuclease P protein component